MALDGNSVDVWLAFDVHFQAEEVQAEFITLLTSAETERMRRFHQEAQRRQFALTRAMQRRVLSSYAAEVTPAEWQFQASAEGRPSLAPPYDRTGLHFNIAHTAGLVAMAVCRHEKVGIDVENLGRAPLAVAERYFSTAEAAQLRALPAEVQPRRFVQLWTLKEAYLKAIGAGLAGGLGRMSFLFDASEEFRFERADDAAAARWQFHQCGAGVQHLLALAVLPAAGGSALEVRFRDFQV